MPTKLKFGSIPKLKNHVEKGWQTVSGKDQVVNTAGFAGHAVSVPTIQHCRLSAEAAVRW